MALNTSQPFFDVFAVGAAAPRFAFVTAAAKHILCLYQAHRIVGMTAAASDIFAPMRLMHRFPSRSFAAMAKGT